MTDPTEDSDAERRITFQLYDQWEQLAGGRDMPSLRDLSAEAVQPFKDQMVLIDLRERDAEPTLQVIGGALKEDLEQDLTLRPLSEIPRRTMLSRLTDHYLEVLANRAPISFDAEFTTRTREKALYRGILLPFSDDGAHINFILGGVRWILESDLAGMPPRPEAIPEAIPEAVPGAAPEVAPEEGQEITPEVTPEDFPEEDRPKKDSPKKDSPEEAPPTPRPPSLENQMARCRALIQGENALDGRSRRALYRILAAILDFHLEGGRHPRAYQALLQDAGLKVQARAPFTPTLKLCFGREYDKTRLTEYAAALSYALKKGHDGKTLEAFLESFQGGIKGCVKAERESRRPAGQSGRNNSLEEARKRVNNMPVLSRFELAGAAASKDRPEGEEQQMCLILGRRKGAVVEVVKLLDERDQAMAQILKTVAKP